MQPQITYSTQHKHIFKMQATLCVSSSLLPLTPTKNFSRPISSPKLGTSLASRCPAIKATAATFESASFNYNSAFSVFPAEACETIGGDACSADMYPEVKLKQEARNDSSRVASESIDRQYLEYNEAKTVFKGEACASASTREESTRTRRKQISPFRKIGISYNLKSDTCI